MSKCAARGCPRQRTLAAKYLDRGSSQTNRKVYYTKPSTVAKLKLKRCFDHNYCAECKVRTDWSDEMCYNCDCAVSHKSRCDVVEWFPVELPVVRVARDATEIVDGFETTCTSQEPTPKKAKAAPQI